jgi:hypothetical protein
MPANRVQPPLKHVAAAVFFCGYLAFQVIYPALSWFVPMHSGFTWPMFSGRAMSEEFTVVFADGSERDVDAPTKFGATVRILGPSVDQRRFVPPWLCSNWEGAETVIVRYPPYEGEDRVSCRSFVR